MYKVLLAQVINIDGKTYEKVISTLHINSK